MMEYIGATGTPITFDAVPIEDGINFHFVLALQSMQTHQARLKMAHSHHIG